MYEGAETEIDMFNDMLGDLGFGDVLDVLQNQSRSPKCDVDTVDHAVYELLKQLSESVDLPIDDDYLEYFQTTKDAVPAVFSLLSLVCDYQTTSGRVAADPGLVLFAVYLCHVRSYHRTAFVDGSHVYLDAQIADLFAEHHGDTAPGFDAQSVALHCQSIDRSVCAYSVDTDVPRKRLFLKNTLEHSPYVDERLFVNSCNVRNLTRMVELGSDPRNGRRVHRDLGLQDDSAIGTSDRFYPLPGGWGQMLPHNTTHRRNQTFCDAIANLLARDVEFPDFCKLVLFTLTEGVHCCDDFRTILSNVTRFLHLGMFICFHNFLHFERQTVVQRLDSMRTTYIDLLSDDLHSLILVRHIVLEAMNPLPTRKVMTREARTSLGSEDRAKKWEEWMPHNGQRLDVDALSRHDFGTATDQSNGDSTRLVHEVLDASGQFVSNRNAFEDNKQRICWDLLSLPHKLVSEVDGRNTHNRSYYESLQSYIGHSFNSTRLPYAELKASRVTFGIRYTFRYLKETSRLFSSIRLVCKLWNSIVRPFCIGPAVAYIDSNDAFSDRKAELAGSSALRGEPAFDAIRLDRYTKSRIYFKRLYVYEGQDGNLAYREQAFPATIVIGRAAFFKLRLAAVDERDLANTKLACIHTPALLGHAGKTRVHANANGYGCGMWRTIVDVRGAVSKFESAEGSLPILRFDHVVSGMFFVHPTDSMIDFDWSPTTSSLALSSATNKPLAPLKLIVSLGRLQSTCNDMQTTSDPFYVFSRKSTQKAVDEAAAKRRKSVRTIPSDAPTVS